MHPKFFGKRKCRGVGDEFYYNKIRASAASVDDVGGGVLDAPQWIYQTPEALFRLPLPDGNVNIFIFLIWITNVTYAKYRVPEK